MKRLLSFILFLGIISLGCNFMTNGLSDTAIKSTVAAGIAQTQAAMPKPTEPPVVETKAVQPPAEDTAVPNSDSPSTTTCELPAFSPKPSGLITKVTMAEDAAGDKKDPVNPTKVFANDATIHAVVAISNVPNNTTFKATWYANDTQGAADCNTKIDDFSMTTNGSRNIDFQLKPTSTWPTGTYRVEIYVNKTLDTIVNYSVK
jgi:hypothetical protein